MKKMALILVILVLGMVILLAGKAPAAEVVKDAEGCTVPPQPVSAYAAAATAADYAKATAHDPHFSDRKIWPHTTGKEAYATYQWPKGRVLVWAHPDMGDNAKAFNVGDAGNWLENGKPATKLWDESTDLVFPDAYKPYTVSLASAKRKQQMRHVTIGANAVLVTGGDGVGRIILGNLWIKRGGKTGNQGATSFLGPGDVFVRNDNDFIPNMDTDWRNLANLSQYFNLNKAKGGSIEFLGHISTSDEFNQGPCLVIVGPDSRVQPGRNATPTIDTGGVLALMDGARFYSWTNNWDSRDLGCSGTIQAGLPDRPVKRDAYLLLTHKNFTGARYQGPNPWMMFDKEVREFPRLPSLLLKQGAELKSYSTDLSKARLVISYAGYLGMWDFRAPKGSNYEREQLDRRDHPQERFAWLDALPQLVTVYFAPGVKVEGVFFDHIAPGGLLMAKPQDRSTWKNVTFGTHNGGKPEALVQAVEELKGDNPHY